MSGKPYAYVCTLCDHLASRHLLKDGAESVVDGPYLCSHEGCDCEISQITPLYGITQAQCGTIHSRERLQRAGMQP